MALKGSAGNKNNNKHARVSNGCISCAIFWCRYGKQTVTEAIVVTDSRINTKSCTKRPNDEWVVIAMVRLRPARAARPPLPLTSSLVAGSCSAFVHVSSPRQSWTIYELLVDREAVRTSEQTTRPGEMNEAMAGDSME